VVHEDVREGMVAIFPRLWRYCLVLTSNRDRANDLAQATCLRAIEKADQFQRGTHLDRWLFKIAQRVWLNELRADAVRRGGGMAPLDELDIPDTSPGAESNIFSRDVLVSVMGLPEAQRSVVLLVYVEGFKYREAAEVLEIPIGTVMSRLAAARAKITHHFADRKVKQA